MNSEKRVVEKIKLEDGSIYIKGIGKIKSVGKPDIEKLVHLLLKHKQITG